MWSDRETTEDCLGFAAYVDALQAVVLAKDIAPVTVGVFGDWGSGKTSLMRMLQCSLPGEEAGVINAWFNPWQFEGKDEVQTALIHTILDVLEKQQSLLEDAKNAIKKLKDSASLLKLAKYLTKTVMTLSPDIVGFLDCFSDPADKLATTMREFNADFSRYLESQKISRLVIFIDDLDRCEPQRALELFETIHLFLASERCAFVIGADSEKIRLAVSLRYGNSTQDGVSRDYLEKVIQIPFQIPYQSPLDVELYLHSLLVMPHIRDDARPAFRDRILKARAENQNVTNAVSQWLSDNQPNLSSTLASIQAEIACVLPHLNTIVGGLKGNPRQIKRFLNIYKLRRTLAVTNGLAIDDAITVKLLAMEYTWPQAFGNVVESYDSKTQRSAVLEELYNTYDGKDNGESSSKIIEDLLSVAGLKDFLVSQPRLEDISLSPYLFLAQTSLEKYSHGPISTVQELASSIVAGIISGDKIRVRMAVNKAKDLDADSLGICVSQCVPSMFDKNANISTQAIIGIDDLLLQAGNSLAMVLTALEGNNIASLGARMAVDAMLKRHLSRCRDETLKKRLDSLRDKYGIKKPAKTAGDKV